MSCEPITKAEFENSDFAQFANLEILSLCNQYSAEISELYLKRKIVQNKEIHSKIRPELNIILNALQYVYGELSKCAHAKSTTTGGRINV